MALAEDKRSAIPARRVLEFYARPAKLTSAGKHARLFDELPSDVDQLVRAVQHLVVYDVVAADFYGFSIPEERQGEIHIRPMEEILDRLLALEGRGLTVPRPVDTRLVGRCRHFMLLLIAALRAKGISLGDGAASEPISIPLSSKTTGSANTGTLIRSAGFSSIRSSTRYGGKS